MKLPLEEKEILRFIEDSIKQLFNSVKDSFAIPPVLDLENFDQGYIEDLKEDNSIQIEGRWNSPFARIWFNPWLNTIYASPEYIWYKGLKEAVEAYDGKSPSTEELQIAIYSAVVSCCAVYFYSAKYMESPLNSMISFMMSKEEGINIFFGEENFAFDISYEVVISHMPIVGAVYRNDDSLQDILAHRPPTLFARESTPRTVDDFVMEYLGLCLNDPANFKKLVNGRKITVYFSYYNGPYTDTIIGPDFVTECFEPSKDMLDKIWSITRNRDKDFVSADISADIDLANPDKNKEIRIDYVVYPRPRVQDVRIPNEYLADVKTYTDKVYKPYRDTEFIDEETYQVKGDHGGDIYKRYICLGDMYPNIAAFVYSKVKQDGFINFDRFSELSKESILYNFVVCYQATIMAKDFIFEERNNYCILLRRAVIGRILEKADIKNELYNKDFCLEIANHVTLYCNHIGVKRDSDFTEITKDVDAIMDGTEMESVTKMITTILPSPSEGGPSEFKELFEGEALVSEYRVFVGERDDFVNIYNKGYKVVLDNASKTDRKTFILCCSMEPADKFILKNEDTGEFSVGIIVNPRDYKLIKKKEEL